MSNADDNMARKSLEEIKGSRRHMAASARDDYSEASHLQVVVDPQQGENLSVDVITTALNLCTDCYGPYLVDVCLCV